MWFLKSKAQEKAGGPYQRGAMTIPDPDNKLRKYLDKCTQVYGRDSSHLKEQQKKEGGQGRGIDFYEGTGGAGVADPDRLLPSGMRTLLYQQATTSKGDSRIYIKMETESARFNPAFKQAPDTPDPRALEGADVGRSILHLGNLIKAKLGMSQGEDEALASFREQTDKSVVAAYDEALKSSKKNSPAAYEILKTGSKRVHQMLTNIDNIAASGITVDGTTYGHLERCANTIVDLYGSDNLDARFGGEVVLEASDLAGPALDSPAALGLLNTNIAAVENCQHTDDYQALVKVQSAAQKTLLEVAGTKTLEGDKAVQSTAKQLQDKLAPLGRLIAKMPKPAPEELSMVVGLDPKDKVIGEASFDIAGARKQGQDAPLMGPGQGFSGKDKGFDKLVADPKLEKADFSDAGTNAPIVLLGHGTTPMFASSKGNVHATTFGNKTAEDVVKYLKKTLKKDYAGVIYLDGCFTGAGKGPLVFADKVYNGLVKAGYEYLQIKGNLGAAVTTADGKELVTPADVDTYRQDLKERHEALRASLKELEASYESRKEALKSTKKGRELILSLTAIDKEMLDSKRHQDISNRMADLEKILKDPKDLQIEALTGTWGPEKSPPKK
jgi:hypothetical protein